MKLAETPGDIPCALVASDPGDFTATLDRVARRWPDNVAVVDPGTERALTYAELRSRVRAVVGWFRTLGISDGSKVCIAAGNSISGLELLAGALYGRFVAVPCNPDLGPKNLTHVLDHCDSGYVFASREHFATIERGTQHCGRHIDVIEVDGDLSLPECAERSTTVRPDDDALIIYTSGTTGTPKGVLHGTASLIAAAEITTICYELSAADRLLCVLPVHHANSIHKILATWISGGTVVLPPRFEVRKFWHWVAHYSCTWSALVPSIISQLSKFSEKPDRCSMRFVRSSSAPLPTEWHRQFEEKFQIPLIEGMGATEVGPIFCSPLPPKPKKIGSPGKNVPRQDVKIVGADGDVLGNNERGIIAVRGPSMMTGYYKDPVATESALTSDGWFRTGDMGYRDPQGFFFVTGRAKEIVIKAGVNIALREIDEALQSHPGVDDAACAKIDDEILGEDIAAYVVLASDSLYTDSDLLDFCTEKIGAFKTPSEVLLVAEIPRSQNGKVQRHLLQERFGPEARSCSWQEQRSDAERHRFVAPRTPMESILARIWGGYLEASSVSIHDDFFALGGYSLLAIRMLSPLRRELGTAFSLTTFFKYPTVAEQALIATLQKLSQLSTSERHSILTTHQSSPARGESLLKCDLETLRQLSIDVRIELETVLLQKLTDGCSSDQIPPRPPSEFCPLSFAQQRIWFLTQMSPDSIMYNTGEAVRLHGPLDTQALEDALNAVIERHEILRARVVVIDGQPWQQFRDHMRIRLVHRDLAVLPGAKKEEALECIVSSSIRLPYKLDREPLIRATAVKLADDDHVFILCCHHIVTDGWSTHILLRDLEVMYRDRIRGGGSALARRRIQYSDFATWERERLRGQKIQQEMTYWRERLRGVPTVLELPTDRPRAQVQSHRGHRQNFRLSDRLSKRVHEMSRKHQVSSFTMLAAGFAALLHRYSGQTEFVVGIPFADRDRPELQDLIGMLIDTHVIRFSVSGQSEFRDIVTQTRAEVAESYAHSDLPFELVVDAVLPNRDPGRMPLCQVMVNWREPSTQLSSLALDGISSLPMRPHNGSSKFDLSMTFSDADDVLDFEIEYDTELFESETIERMAGNFQVLLNGAMENPVCPIGKLPLITDSEQRQLLVEWDGTSTEFDGADTVHELFEQQVLRTPHAPAILADGVSLTYLALNERANQLAALLRSYGVRPECFVGILMDRSADTMIAICAVLKAGGAYVPLDPEYPRARLELIVAETEMTVVLTQAHLRDRIPIEGLRVIRVDDAWSESAGQYVSNPTDQVSSENAAYVIYTSGSTGQPKGVINTHAGIVNRLRWMQGEFDLDTSDRVLQKTSFSFDVSVWEMFWPLLSGALLVVARPGGHRDPEYLVQEIVRHRITAIHFVPSMLRLFLQHPNVERCDTLKWVFCSGEALPYALQEQFFSRLKTADLHNLYGPTEAAIEVTHWRCQSDSNATVVPIGRPIANARIRIVDSMMQPSPIGVPGELLIGGLPVARGYLAHPELTSERFIADPFSTTGRLYRTGDVARWRPDGAIEYLGRIDTQVKLRGYRIELGEIETVLARHGSVSVCAVALREDTPDDQRLVAYVVAAEEEQIDPAALRQHLEADLPAYMIPVAYVQIAKLPITDNGKLDRDGLPEPTLSQTGEDSFSPLEQSVAEIWYEVLSLETCDPLSNFFELGGHSLNAMQIAWRLRSKFDVEVPLIVLFDGPTIRQQARWLAENAVGPAIAR